MAFTSNILSAARAFRSGCTLAYPTETVYGLGCLPTAAGLARILKIKNRSARKGMILIASRREFLEPFTAKLDEAVWQRILRPSRRATTWIVPASADAPALLTGNHQTVAIRITRHRPTAALSTAAKSSLVSTSANESGQAPTKDYRTLSTSVLRRTNLVLTGCCGADKQPSQIKNAISGKLIASRIR